MVDFYCDILGFETSWNGIDIDVEMRLGDMRILLFPRESIEKMTRQKFTYPSGINGTMEISFDAPTFADVDKEYSRAVDMGAKPIMEPTTEPVIFLVTFDNQGMVVGYETLKDHPHYRH